MNRWTDAADEERMIILCRLTAPLARLLEDQAVRSALDFRPEPGMSPSDGLRHRGELARPSLSRRRAEWIALAALLTGRGEEQLRKLPAEQAALHVLDCLDQELADFLLLLRRHGAERTLAILTELRRWPGMAGLGLLLFRRERLERQTAYGAQLVWLSARALHGGTDWDVPDWFTLFPERETTSDTLAGLAERFARRLGADKEEPWTNTTQTA